MAPELVSVPPLTSSSGVPPPQLPVWVSSTMPLEPTLPPAASDSVPLAAPPQLSVASNASVCLPELPPRVSEAAESLVPEIVTVYVPATVMLAAQLELGTPLDQLDAVFQLPEVAEFHEVVHEGVAVTERAAIARALSARACR